LFILLVGYVLGNPMEECYKNEILLVGADPMGLTDIEDEERVGTAELFLGVSSAEEAVAGQDDDVDGRVRCVVLPHHLAGSHAETEDSPGKGRMVDVERLPQRVTLPVSDAVKEWNGFHLSYPPVS